MKPYIPQAAEGDCDSAVRLFVTLVRLKLVKDDNKYMYTKAWDRAWRLIGIR